MQGIEQIWTREGLFAYDGGIPARLHRRITVPSSPSDDEVAAMVELAMRIGLQLLQLPAPIFEGLFVEDQADDKKTAFDSGPQMVLGHEKEWLQSVLGPAAQGVLTTLAALPDDAGLLLFQPEFHVVTITGTTPYGVLRAARYMASEGFGKGLASGTCITILPENGACQSVSTVRQNESSLDLDTGEAIPQEPHVSSRRSLSLHDVMTHSGLYQSMDDLLPEFIGLVSVDGVAGIHKSMIGLSARFSLEAASVRFPVTIRPPHFEQQENRVAVCFRTACSDSVPAIKLEGDFEGNNQLCFKAANASGFRQLMDHVTNSWFQPVRESYLQNWRSKVAALQSPHPDVFQRASCDLQFFNEDIVRSVASARVPARMVALVKDSLEARGIPVEASPTPPLSRQEWSDPGELADLESAIFRSISSLGPAVLERATEEPLWAEVFTTVSSESFLRWGEGIRQRVEELRLPPIQLVQRNAHKSGLHWFLDSVLPELRTMQNLGRLRIEARTFAPKEKHLDLPQRFLQELFPVDAIVVRELGWPMEKIQLHLHSEQDGPMFRVTAYAEDEGLLRTWAWEGWVRSARYSPDYPEQGFVCTPTGGVRLFQAGTVHPHAIEAVWTNAERFWNWYQGVVSQIPEKIGAVSTLPKFFRLDCHLTLDADELPLGVHEELSSLPEALHEDVYFYTLHSLGLYGRAVQDPGWKSPGAVVPFVHIQPGSPHALVEIYGMESETSVQFVLKDGSHHELQLATETSVDWSGLEVAEVSLHNGSPRVRVRGRIPQSLLEQCERWLNQERHVPVSLPDPFAKDLDGDVLQNEDVEAWLKASRYTLPGSFSGIDKSFLGAPIYLVELYRLADKAITSRNKQALYKPTVFINARHHANEVSSTNAALRLIAKIAHDPSVLERLNLVIIPLQNVDGASLHKQLMVEHPFWKHHSARYNACGYEFAQDYFKKLTPFGESRTYQQVWETWHPDIVLDDHGIPSHEWIQPFSGYNSPPMFPVSYWIPHAQMYTIWNVLEDASTPWTQSHESLVARINQHLANHAAVASLNAEFLSRFIRWGHNFAPLAFPVELAEEVMTYRWRIQRDLNSTSYLARFSEWVTADLITEVNDETVHGDSLNACASAHLTVHEGLLEFVQAAHSEVSLFCVQQPSATVTVGLKRQRPLRV